MTIPKPIQHTALQKSTFKIYTGPVGISSTVFCSLWYLVFSFLFDWFIKFLITTKPTAHALYGLMWVCDRPCISTVIYTNVFSTVILTQNTELLCRRTEVDSNNKSCRVFNKTMNNEQGSCLNMWHDARTSYDRHRWAVQCVSNVTMADHRELWDTFEHVYTVSKCKSSQTASDYNFAKTWAAIKKGCTCSSAKQWPHPTDSSTLPHKNLRSKFTQDQWNLAVPYFILLCI